VLHPTGILPKKRGHGFSVDESELLRLDVSHAPTTNIMPTFKRGLPTCKLAYLCNRGPHTLSLWVKAQVASGEAFRSQVARGRGMILMCWRHLHDSTKNVRPRLLFKQSGFFMRPAATHPD
jgi:hypothetical protein